MTAPPTPASKSRSAIQLTPIEVPKASDVLAGGLRERILSGEFAEGTPLPPERELVTQTRMSRTTVREALRILEVQGLVRIKAGRAGGAFVQKPGEDDMARSVGLMIRGRQIRLAALFETREAVEPFCGGLAAKNRTDEDLAALDAANVALAESGSDLNAFLEANIDFHVAVAKASHNELLTGFMTAISKAIYSATATEGFITDDVRATAVRAHKTITNAIRAGDPEAASRRMSRHVHSHAQAAMAADKRTAIEVADGN